MLMYSFSIMHHASVPNAPARSAAPQSSMWKAPLIGLVKINVDGGLSIDTLAGAMTAVCRNHNGMFLGSSALAIPGVLNPAVLEAIACREALALDEDLSLQDFVVACDCKPVVYDIRDGTGRAYLTMVRELSLHSINFNICSFIFESRSSNVDAHNLDKHTLLLNQGHHLWLISPHDTTCIPLYAQVDQ